MPTNLQFVQCTARTDVCRNMTLKLVVGKISKELYNLSENAEIKMNINLYT